MTGAAELRIAGRPGVFLAETCRVEGAVVHVRGRWRYRVGANHADFRYGELVSYSWPLGRCREIRWAEPERAS